jgi:ATP-dependent Zn protease
MGDKYSERTRYMMDKESLDLVKEAFQEAKNILQEKRVELLEFSEMLQNSTNVSTFKKSVAKSNFPLLENQLLEKVDQNLTSHFIRF